MTELTKQQKDIKRAAKEFAQKEFDLFADDGDKSETYPKKLFKKATQLGFIGISIDEAYEGGGLGLLEQMLVLEEFWKVDAGCGNILFSSLGSEILLKYADKEQKRVFLPKIADGKLILGACVDYRSLENGVTFDKCDEQNYVLNGSYSFVLHGTLFDKVLVFATASGNEESEDKRAAFLLDKDQKGILAEKMEGKLGVRSTDIGNLRLENVKAGKECIVGIENQGNEQLNSFTDLLCLYTCAQAIGLTEACLDRAKKYSSKRVQFGKPINHFQLVKYKLSEMISKLEICKSLSYKMAEEMQNDRYDKKMPAILSLFAKEMAVVAASETLQIHGGFGYIKETGIERLYRDAQFLNCFGIGQETAKLRIIEKS